ncbi:sushi domain-containing protein 6 isoform X2 [Micropterus dolomieu]|uniref:sushi domain-containing protein 6 isoform X2 n=1 Tax=Micropterus dolomieu TaxID=147949 RepID=UPI001E8CC6D7|nr:sushi domain-containing protein 6 isoform X2 [Micropterus dolomieu]
MASGPFPEDDGAPQVGGAWQLAAANRKPGCRCQTQLIDESGREQPRRSHLLLSRSRRRQADNRALIHLHFTSSDLSVNPPQICSSARAAASVRDLTAAASFTALRKSGLMSASVLYPWPCGHYSLVCGLLLLAFSPLLATGRLNNCTHPLVPEHGGFRCDPSPCRGFPQKSSIHFFCEPGYHISSKIRVSRCRHGKWLPPIPACIPNKEGPNVNSDTGVNDSMPSMATTAVGVSIFLLTTTACLVVKSRLYPCQSHSRRSSDQLDLMVDGLPVSLPSYEEAVYGSWGQRLPACSAPGPTQLLLAQEESLNNQSDGSHRPLLSSQSPDNPPPPYEEVQSSRARDRISDGDVRQLQVALSDDKDT